MKLKARDIIAGWPRGKSTGGLGTWSADKYGDFVWFAYFGRSSWSDEDFEALKNDYQANEAEHARQQRMFYAYLERYRRLTEFGDCLLDPGYYICFGQRCGVGVFKSKTF